MYSNHFLHTDEVVRHLGEVVKKITNPLLEQKYVGFVTIEAVSVYELAIKDIFVDFARKKHTVFGDFTEAYFNKVNGRITVNDIKSRYIIKFGIKYQAQFKKNFSKKEKSFFKIHGRTIKSSYDGIIARRNNFAHGSKMNSHATYAEVAQAYEDGKEVMHCLATSMTE